jgi:hypothetical protein
MVSRNLIYSSLSVFILITNQGLKKFCILAFVFTLSLNANAGLMFNSDFEKGMVAEKTTQDSGWRKQTCKKDSISVVKGGEAGAPSPRAGKYMLKTLVRVDDRPQGCTKKNKIRTELIGDEVAPPEKERWIGFSTYIPKNLTREEKPISFFQLHYNSSGYELFNLETKDGKYALKNYQVSKGKRVREVIAPVEYNTWTDWVFHVKFTKPSSKDTGYVQIWKNGKLIYNWKGHSVGNGQKDGAVRKIGQYVHKGWPGSNPPYMVMYHDEFRIGDQNSNYSEVAPGGKKPTTNVKLPAAPTGLSVLKQ